MKYFICDTDLGCDCDDAGALAMFHWYENRGLGKLLAVTYGTSSPFGPGNVDAINRYYGRPHIPVGTLKEPGFLDDEQFRAFGPALCSEFPTAYPTADAAPDAVSVFRRALAEAPGPVTVVSIGPLRNFPAFLRSGPDEISPLTGEELIRSKAEALVTMAGYYPQNGRIFFEDGNEMGPEFNVTCDIEAARYLTTHWPTPIYFIGFEVGWYILTGRKLLENHDNSNPVRRAYELYCNGERYSWDQTAVLYAAEGNGDLVASEPGVVEIDDEGRTHYRPDPAGRHYYLKANADWRTLSEKIEERMTDKPLA